MERVSRNRSFNGYQDVYRHASVETGCDMTFAIYVPDEVNSRPLPVLWYLSGLTCSHVNVMEKGEYRRFASEYGLIVVCPDTSPRGEGIPDEPDNWQIGQGAGFYVDATEQPYSKNYRMYSYVSEELRSLVEKEFSVDRGRQAICGHSMGGHGALIMALKKPDVYKSCSVFSPIVSPSRVDWARGAFQKYLGDDEDNWRDWDACFLIEDGKKIGHILVDQGGADPFLEEGLRPWLLEEACSKNNIELRLRIHEGYDHSYYFISSFMEDHFAWHGGVLSL